MICQEADTNLSGLRPKIVSPERFDNRQLPNQDDLSTASYKSNMVWASTVARPRMQPSSCLMTPNELIG